jgi:hypothetical protein
MYVQYIFDLLAILNPLDYFLFLSMSSLTFPNATNLANGIQVKTGVLNKAFAIR